MREKEISQFCGFFLRKKIKSGIEYDDEIMLERERECDSGDNGYICGH